MFGIIFFIHIVTMLSICIYNMVQPSKEVTIKEFVVLMLKMFLPITAQLLLISYIRKIDWNRKIEI